jgi:hypothetical protein
MSNTTGVLTLVPNLKGKSLEDVIDFIELMNCVIKVDAETTDINFMKRVSIMQQKGSLRLQESPVIEHQINQMVSSEVGNTAVCRQRNRF